MSLASWRRLSLSLLLFLVLLLLCQPQHHSHAIVHIASTHHSHLRVSLHGDLLQDAPSCQTRMAQIELYNVHATDPIRIDTITRESERTELLMETDDDWETGEGNFISTNSDSDSCESSLAVPNQLHVSDFEPFEILPGQIAIVPVAFLPRFPFSSATHGSPDIQSPYELADYLDILESDIGRSNFETNKLPTDVERYQIQTLLQIHTSHGNLHLPLEATSQRRNDFGLPDTIYFDDSIQRTVNHITMVKERAKHNITIVDQVTLQPISSVDGDCFELYARNPAVTAGLHVIEARVSRPSQMQLYVNSGNQSDGNDSTTTASAAPLMSHVVTDWSSITPSVFGGDDQTLMIPADGNMHYVVSICFRNDDSDTTTLDPEMEPWIDTDSEWSLGYLQLKTTRDTFFVHLEKSRSEFQSILPTNWSLPEQPRARTYLSAIPEALEETFLVSSRPSADISVDLQSITPAPVSIMRASIALNTLRYFNETMDEWFDHYPRPSDFDTLGISLRLREFNTSMPRPMRPGESAVKAITIHCTVDFDKFNRLSDEFYLVEVHGAVVVRGTTKSYLAFSDWEKSLKSDLKSSFVFEVPIRIKIYTGYLVFLVEDSTHPFEPFFHSDYYYDGLTGVMHSFYPRHAAHTELALNKEERKLISPDFIKGVKHELRVFSTLNESMALKELRILGNNDDHRCSVCGRFDAYIDDESPGGWELIHDTEVPDLGKIFLQYRYPNKEKPLRYENCRHAVPELCTLRLSSEPSSGIHDMGLFVYSGQLHLSQSETIVDSGLSGRVYESKSSDSMAGFERVFRWFLESKAGYALRSVLGSTMEQGKNIERDAMLLSRYLHSLSRHSRGMDPTKLNPIVLDAGAIAQGEVETIPLFITNYNPMPVTVSIEIGEVEGLMIAIGRDETSGKGDGNDIYDHFPPSSGGRVLENTYFGPERLVHRGRFRGHPVQALRNFLMTDNIARSVLDRFAFRDDVTMSPSAMARFPFLKSIFRENIVGHFQTMRHPRRFREAGWNLCGQSIHPAKYGRFEKKLEDAGRGLQGPIMISVDRKTSRPLSICWFADGEPDDKKSDDVNVVVPPGGVVRYDVSIRAPPMSVLEKDITQFLGTGLVLRTDYGDVMPLLVSFEALKGKLELAHLPSVSGSSMYSNSAGAIHVPPGLFGAPSGEDGSSILIPPHNVHSFSDFARGETIVARNTSTNGPGVSLYMKSSFLRDVQLRKVEACNPWFEVSLVNQTAEHHKADPFLGVYIGIIQSVISCDSSGNNGESDKATSFPSFFRCALNWLSRRLELQPRGCGSRQGTTLEGNHSAATHVNEVASIEKTIRALKRAVLVSEWSDTPQSVKATALNSSKVTAFKSGRRTTDSVVLPTVVEAISEAWHELQVAHDSGLLSLGTSLNALVEYNATPDELPPLMRKSDNKHPDTHLLSLPIRNITVNSILETPKLLVGPAVSTLATSGDGPRVLEFEPTLVANVSYGMLPIRNPTGVPVRVRLRVAPSGEDTNVLLGAQFAGEFSPPFVQGQAGTPSIQDRALRDWWDHRGTFLQADSHGDMIRTFHGVSIVSQSGARISITNPSFSGSSGLLVGCGPRCAVRNDRNFDPKTLSTVGAAASVGSTLSAQPLLQGGPLVSGGSATMEGLGPPAFGIPYGSLDEVIVPPYGNAKIGPIMFRPPGRASTMGCAATKGSQQRDPCITQVFETLVFLENSLTGLERVQLRGRALWQQLVFLDPASVEFGDIEVRNGRSTLVFSGSSSEGKRGEPRPVVKEVVFQNEGDIAVTVESAGLSHATKLKRRIVTSPTCSMGQFRVLNCETSLFPFILRPGQNYSFFIEHRPVCMKRKNFVKFTVVLDSSSKSRDKLVDRWQSPYTLLKGRSRRPIPVTIPEASLLVGYEMTSRDFMACRPVSPAVASNYSLNGHIVFSEQTGNHAFRSTMQMLWLGMISMVLSISILVHRQRLKWLTSAVEFFQRYFSYTQRAHGQPLELPESMGHAPKRIVRNWNLSFLCLAKSDPSAADLQALTNQMGPATYSKPPDEGSQRIPLNNRTDESVGERNVPSTSGQNTAGSVRRAAAGASERIRSSEAIFRKFNPNVKMDQALLPVKLGWKAAASKGIINNSVFEQLPLKLKTTELLEYRISNPPEIRKWVGRNIEEHRDDPSDLSSSIDEISVDNDVPKTVPGPRIVIPHNISTHMRSDEGDVGDDEKSDSVVVVSTPTKTKTTSRQPIKDDFQLQVPSLSAEIQKEEVIKPKKHQNTALEAKKSSTKKESSSNKNYLDEEIVGRRTTATEARGRTTTDTKQPERKESSKEERPRSLKSQTNPEKSLEQSASPPKSKRSQQKREQKKEDKAATQTKSPKEPAKETAKKKPKSKATTPERKSPSSPIQADERQVATVPAVPVSPVSVPTPPASPGIRPPPGLLPPPGFDGEQSPNVLHLTSPELTRLDIDHTVDALIPPPPPSTGSSYNSGSSIPPLADTPHESLLGPLSYEMDQQPTPLPGFSFGDEERRSRLDFDVMDFLDGILEEETHDSPRISLNPWATDANDGGAVTTGLNTDLFPAEDKDDDKKGFYSSFLKD